MIDETLSELEKIAWVAGWFEGEGSVINRTPSSQQELSYMILCGVSTDLDTLHKIQSYVGGTVTGPILRKSPSGNDAKPVWRWALQSTNEAKELALKMKPFLGKRRSNKIDEVISRIQFHQPLTLDERFWKLVDKTDTCWFWQGHIDKYGFGSWGYAKNKRKQAHRYSYESLHPSVKNRLVNFCGAKHCVNPTHWKER